MLITGITLSLITSEWLLLHAHWAMDCNVIIPIFILALDFILLGKMEKVIITLQLFWSH